VHEDVRVLGEPARIERAVVRVLELTILARAKFPGLSPGLGFCTVAY
jgi:hypothetical protein